MTHQGSMNLLMTLMSRLMTHQGNMNPRMSEVDIVPDDDLNTRLKFYVSLLLFFLAVQTYSLVGICGL